MRYSSDRTYSRFVYHKHNTIAPKLTKTVKSEDGKTIEESVPMTDKLKAFWGVAKAILTHDII